MAKNTILEKCLAKPLDLAGSIAYGDDAVVSKTLVDKDAGTITVFAFDKGQGLSTHSAPFDATVMILEGSAKITIDKNETVVNTGELIVMPANIPHGLQAEEKFKMLLIMIKQKA
jgi:quercetin dioxygenase-like cupin family protein